MSFGSTVHGWTGDSMKEFNRFKRAVGIELFSGTVLSTPVLSGRLRGNWRVSLKEPKRSAREVKDKTGARSLGEIRSTISQSEAGDALILQNNLPYASRIEYDGWSHTKAPKGMVRINFLRVTANLKKFNRKR